MDITAKLELTHKDFINLPWNPNKTHILVGQASGHSVNRFNEAGEIMTSNVKYVEVVDNVVYAITNSASRYELTNVVLEEVLDMIERLKETHDITVEAYA